MKDEMEKTQREMKELRKSVTTKGEKTWTSKTYPERLLEKAKRDEYIDLTELREEGLNREMDNEQTLAENGNMEFVYREKTPSSSKKTVASLCLGFSLIDLYRKAGPKGAQRLQTAIKHFQFCASLTLQNRHKVLTVVA